MVFNILSRIVSRISIFVFSRAQLNRLFSTVNYNFFTRIQNANDGKIKPYSIFLNINFVKAIYNLKTSNNPINHTSPCTHGSWKGSTKDGNEYHQI